MIRKIAPAIAIGASLFAAQLYAGCAIAPKSTHLKQISASQITSEVRAMWVVRSSITSPALIDKVISDAKSHHFNALFIQVRGRGDAYYTSSLEPRAEELSNQPLDFDPLRQVIEKAHANGIQVHAWLDTCYVWGSSKRPLDPHHVLNAHRDWFSTDANGNFRTTNGPECEGAFLSPANLNARKHIHDVFVDVATRYDVDGIHFDYVRYPNVGYDYSYASLTRFKSEMDDALSNDQRYILRKQLGRDRLAYVHTFPRQFQDFRRRQVTEMVRDISKDIKQVKPWVLMSAAVFADAEDAYISRGQDWKTWLRQGYLDAVVPMAYSTSTAKVAAQISDAVQCARGSKRYVLAGIGSWRIPAASSIQKINAARAAGAAGIVLFSYGGITKDGATSAYLDKIQAECCPNNASIPYFSCVGPRPGTPTAHAEPGGVTGNGG